MNAQTPDPLQADNDDLESLLDLAKQIAAEHLSNLADLPTSRPTPNVPPGPPLPDRGLGTRQALDEFRDRFNDVLVASPGPRYFGYVTGGVTPAALVGDWLTSAFDQNTQSPAGPGDFSALIELETIALLRDLLNLPADFDGGFVTGATMANFTCLGAARQWAAARLGVDAARDGVPTGIRVLSATPHSSAVKCLAMLGLGSANLTRIATPPGRESIDLDHLARELAASTTPAIVIGSAGTVNTVDFDDMERLAELKRQHDFWWHVDAAFGGFAACSPAHAHLLAGWESADSLTVDGHKWLNVPYDSGVYLIRRDHATHQRQTFQNSSAPYLGDPTVGFNYLNFLPENSRRCRALPAWLTLKAYGRSGHRQIVERCVNLARRLGERLDRSETFQLAAPVRLNVVCFTLRQPSDPTETQRRLANCLNHLDHRGVAFLTPTTYEGKACLRAALVNWRTTAEDIDRTFEELEAAGRSVS